MSESLQFKISSALKDIIGKDLITDDFVAIFELVKNAYDAHAENVEIVFKDIVNGLPTIIIKDDGKGMNKEDIENKWLFVAYSAKKEGTEDNDYRNKIFADKAFAGAKGIGRFSCDRLGDTLRLESVKIDNLSKKHILTTNWRDFEANLQEEFADINVTYESQNIKDNNVSGTELIISGLRSEWDLNKINKLKESLAKLISPQEEEPENDEDDNQQFAKFNIYIKCEDYSIDEKVENFIFETLEIKTTKIEVTIDRFGVEIATEVKDGGTLIYNLKEKNSFSLLRDVRITLYYLNQSAKQTFKRRMGLNTKDYGSIFLYKNGVRIFPYGEPGEDPLKLDLRKAQKPSIYLGNKDLIGRIIIRGSNTEFKETSSRNDGLINNETYSEFIRFLDLYVVQRLEKYVIDVQKWGGGMYLSIEDEELSRNDKVEFQNRILNLITGISNSKNIISINYNDNLLEFINNRHSDNAIALIRTLYKVAKDSNNNQILEIAERTEKKVRELNQALIETQRSEEIERQKASDFLEELNETASQNLFLKNIKNQDFDDLLNLMHHIGISTSTIRNNIKDLQYRIEDKEVISNQDLKEALGRIDLEANKITSISRFATKANFKINTIVSNIDIIGFSEEYLLNIAKTFLPSSLRLKVRRNPNDEFKIKFRPFELIVIYDNLINNSKKAKANEVSISMSTLNEKTLQISFSDNGIGIPDQNMDKIFDYGFTTTEGSGIGLSHVKELVERIGGAITINKNYKPGTELIITIYR